MTIQEFKKHQADFFIELAKRHARKQEEYGDGKNPFHNFDEAIGLSLHNDPEKVGWEFCVKHLQSVKDILNTLEYDQAMIDEKFGDIIIYMTLIHGMLTKRKQNEKSLSRRQGTEDGTMAVEN